MERGWGVVVRDGERVVGARACSQKVHRLVETPREENPLREGRTSVARHPGAVLAANVTAAALRPTNDSPNDTEGTATPTQLQQKQPLAVSAIGDAKAETRHHTNFQ